MTLDGFTVNVGDSIYDILMERVGIVTFTSVSTMTLDFGLGRTLVYSTGGTVAGARRAYWRNPLLTLPRKDDAQWGLLQAVVDTIRENP